QAAITARHRAFTPMIIRARFDRAMIFLRGVIAALPPAPGERIHAAAWARDRVVIDGSATVSTDQMRILPRISFVLTALSAQ
ncbi:MAG: hypothetical protein FWF69_02455, partial [Firmicutes bacterium]|nr:hypothetical protein [Bacillota bacterium]